MSFTVCSTQTKPMAISNLTHYHLPPSPSLTRSGTVSPGMEDTFYFSTSDRSEEMTVQERRQRNKMASAKYRAKKNRQYDEMKVLMCSMKKENELLIQQVDHLHKENKELKKMLDTLRGKVVAQKIIKQYLCNGLNSAEKMLTPQ